MKLPVYRDEKHRSLTVAARRQLRLLHGACEPCDRLTTGALSNRLQLEGTPLAQPAQLHLVLLIERGEPSPIIPGREQREKRNGEVIVRLDGEHDHVEKIGADR